MNARVTVVPYIHAEISKPDITLAMQYVSPAVCNYMGSRAAERIYLYSTWAAPPLRPAFVQPLLFPHLPPQNDHGVARG